jgi:hypothetical protein
MSLGRVGPCDIQPLGPDSAGRFRRWRNDVPWLSVIPSADMDAPAPTTSDRHGSLAEFPSWAIPSGTELGSIA